MATPVFKIVGNTLTITVDISAAAVKKAPITPSRKSRMLCGTPGFVGIDGGPDGLRVSLNVIIPPND